MRPLRPTGRLLTLLLLPGLLFAAGCSKKSSTSSVAPTVPNAVTINGIQTSSGAPGVATLNVSAFDNRGALLTSGTLTEPTLSQLAIVTTGPHAKAGHAWDTVTGSAAVCGSIVNLGNIVAAITLDATGSMSSSDPNHLRSAAAKNFISRMSGSDLAAVGSFDTDTSPTAGFLTLHVYGSGFTTDHTRLAAEVDSATFDGGSTPLWDAAFDSANLDTLHAGNRLALVLTDGDDNSSSKTVQNAVDLAVAHNVKLYMVGLGAYVDEINMKYAAQQTAGFYAVADSASQLQALFANVFNASHASGCITATIQVNGAVPVAGTTISGVLNVKVNGVAVHGPFRVTF